MKKEDATLPATRRGFIAGSALLPLAAAPVAAAPVAADVRTAVERDLSRYLGFGLKPAGGAGDMACGGWLADELAALGYRIERLTVEVPFFEPQRCELICGEATATVWPQPIVVPTGGDGVTGPLVRVDAAGHADTSLTGAIALVDLPYARWSTAVAKPVMAPVNAAFAAGAVAAVIVTNGPTGKVIALNADGRKPMFAGPTAVIGPDEARPFLAAAMRHDRATLHLSGHGGRRPAFNFVGRLDRGRKRWLAISTPRSGWFTCGAERGSGVAAWLWLARWAARAVPAYDLAFVCNTGHEYEYLGAAESLKAIAPPPAETAFWLHIGANFAARDWHETGAQPLPLPSIDPQRYLSVSPSLLPLARGAFAGHVGFEAPVRSDVLAAGELTEIMAAGYGSVAGIFGVHRYHHGADDDARCLSAEGVATTTGALQRFVQQVCDRS